MKVIAGVNVPDNASEIKLAQYVEYLKLKNIGADESELQMSVLGLDLTDSAKYIQIIQHFAKTSKGNTGVLVSMFEEMGKYAKSCTDLKLCGICFGSKFNIFEELTTGAVAHLDTIFDEISEGFNISDDLKEFSFSMSDAKRDLLIDAENELFFRYMERLPEILATIILGAQKKTLDTLPDVINEVAAMPAVKILRIETNFFLFRLMGKATINTPALVHYFALLETLPLTKNHLGFEKRIYLQMQNLIL